MLIYTPLNVGKAVKVGKIGKAGKGGRRKGRRIETEGRQAGRKE